MRGGAIAIVGAGPGDPELITLKALRRIEAADVILYDRLVSGELLDYAREGALRIYCGKAPGRHAMTQENIQRVMLEHALAGSRVVRLKGGDPYVFGRGGEEAIAAAQQGIPYEVIPGITSSIGAAASAGVPLTHRGLSGSFAVVTGTRAEESSSKPRWDCLAHGVDTLVIYMGTAQIGEIRRELLAHGKSASTPVALIENGTTSAERTFVGTLGGMEKLAASVQLRNPALIVIGETVRVREQLLALERMAEQRVVG
ncbi:uroporphyrinogen-III C-methyltransferase [Paenibacillus glufosinatiresistens]|uniref:uroporphyrinogen-III C-methyltransferase n=1 Tax=Paenibacillus glufosinatiresistens TaxID=3070657 RepID=UPI00286D846E|nr:uroporphyrinogen-III C-methyltransferase [Paenibacillus sp. YX.27]